MVALKGAIRAIKRQTQKPSTIIVVDDGSTDGSQKILEDYVRRREIKYIRFETNRGKSYAINYALSFVSTPLMLIVDAIRIYVMLRS